MKKFDYKKDYKNFTPKDQVEITFTDGKNILKEKVQIISISPQKISFENKEIVGECNPEEVINIRKVSSIFDRCVTFLTYTGYSSVLLVFYGLFAVLLLNMNQSLIGILFSLLYFYFIVVLPYIYIYKKKRNSKITITSNLLTPILAFRPILFGHSRHETLVVEFLVMMLIVLLFFWPVHNMLMSLGRVLFSTQSYKHSPFGSVLIFILLSLLGVYIFHLI